MSFVKRLFAKKNNAPRDGYEIFFVCNECYGSIKDGSKRYNCVDCIKSYDLCEECHGSGKAESHTEAMGPHHTFVSETQSHVYTSTLVHKGQTLEQLITNMFKYYSARPALGQYNKDTDAYSYVTFSEVFELVRQFASGLRKLLQDRSSSQSMISISSKPRLEWYLTDLACLLLSVPTVPLGANSSKDQMKYILNKAEVSTVVCSSHVLSGELVKILAECPVVQLIVLMDASKEMEEACGVALPESVCLKRFSEVLTLGKEHPVNLMKIKHNPASIYTVQFTSGSTGDPKGCVFSRNTWKSRISRGVILGHLNVWLSFNPPSHNLERGSFFVTLLNGGKVGIYRGSMEHLLDDFALVRPTVVASTPRLWTMLYNQYLHELHEAYVKWQAEENSPTSDVGADGVSASEIEASLSGTTGASADGSGDDGEHFDVESVPAELRKEVMGRFKSKLGGREQMVTTGGATTGKRVKRFVIDCFDGMFNDGYGSTEVGGIASDGSVLSTTDIKLVDVPEMGYFTTDSPPRGEICVRTPHMIDGYFKSPKITAEKFVDGYFLTGDIGVMENNDKVRIIDRRKNIFKLSQGEFVSPERLEELYTGASCLISQVYVYGNSLQSNVIAVVVPEMEEVLQIGKLLDIEERGFPELCCMPAVKERLLKEVQIVGRENSLPGWEIPVDILLEPHPFTVENGLLTSTLKKSRPRLERKYKSMLEGMYEELNRFNAHRPLEIMVFEWMQKQLQHYELSSGREEIGRATAVQKEEQAAGREIDGDKSQKSFSQLGGDSLSATHLSSLLKEHLSLEVPVRVILKTPLTSIVSDLLHGSSSAETPHWPAEATLELDAAEPSSLSDVPEAASSVFLTGCTGFLGRFILWELLNNTKITKVFCLAQSKKGKGAEERVMEMLHQLQLELNGSAGDIVGLGKLTVLVGDLSEPGLGLAVDKHALLCENVDTIIHNGATVNSVLPYWALKNCNVESTKELLHMAVSKRPKFLHYISTIGVFSPSQSHCDESAKPSMDRLDKLSGYSQSKWVSESLVLAAIAQEKIKGNVSRPGLIGPHTETGHSNLQDWVCWLVRGLVKLDAVPVGQGCEGKQIHWVPVDQVARAVVLISLDRRNWTKCEQENIFHLVNSKTPVTFTKLTDTLLASHPTMNTTSYKEFRTELSRKCKLSEDQVLVSLDLLMPAEGGWPMSPLFRSHPYKVARLETAGVHLELLHDRYVQRYLHYIAKSSL